MVLPELLRCVLASHALEDLCAARVFVEEICEADVSSISRG